MRHFLNYQHGTSRITQKGDELCRVAYTLTEFTLNSDRTAAQFEGTMQVTSGIPLDVGLPDLVLELPDGRNIAIEVAAIRPGEPRREVYVVTGQLLTARVH
ncbi:MAG: hypothetical protein HY682_03560 [Chloroflexi bacterium]|nr:hypothetical protein [Chloroflexota bacterium]